MKTTKREMVINALKEENYREALKIAKSFNRDLTKEQNTIIRRAHEMQWNENFYAALGYNKEKEFNKAVEILKSIYL